MAKSAEESHPVVSKAQTPGSRPTREEVELRAYQIYIDRGGAAGNDMDDWLQAERELLEKYEKTGRMAKARAV